jgi:uncharacterized protein YdeI (YjbR/CyaY-like superfamily)
MEDKSIDAYIAKAPEYAQPILNHLRKLVHEACPNIEETLKWGMPFMDCKGPVCNMAAFKAHCSFGFWKAALMKDSGELIKKQNNAMGHFDKITSLKDLPTDKKIIALIKEAVELNERGIKLPAKEKAIETIEIATPEYFLKELKKNKNAFEVFQAFAPSHRKEYSRWIMDAKTDATKNRRIAQAIEWIENGKGRNWKYETK